MQNVDSNRDGKISFDEFHAMISKCVWLFNFNV